MILSPIRVGSVWGKCEYECSLTQDLEAENLPPDMFSSYVCVARIFLISMWILPRDLPLIDIGARQSLPAAHKETSQLELITTVLCRKCEYKYSTAVSQFSRRGEDVFLKFRFLSLSLFWQQHDFPSLAVSGNILSQLHDLLRIWRHRSELLLPRRRGPCRGFNQLEQEGSSVCWQWWREKLFVGGEASVGWRGSGSRIEESETFGGEDGRLMLLSMNTLTFKS